MKFVDKRCFLYLLTVLMMPCVVFAAPVGNPTQPVIAKFDDTPLSIALEGGSVSERDIENNKNDTSLKSAWGAVKINWAWFDRLDTYMRLGTLDWALRDKRPDGTDLRFMTDIEFAWGFGTKALLLKTDKGLGLGLDASYLQSKPDVTKIKLNGDTHTGVGGKGSYKEWQIALGISLDMSEYTYTDERMRFIPYVGVKYSSVDVEADGFVSGTKYQVTDAEEESNVGVFVGFDLYFSEVSKDEEVGLNVEARAGDELAFSGAITYQF